MAHEPAERALIQCLEPLIGNLFAMYARAHGAHWNVEGPWFPVLHGFFGSLYEDVFGSIDHFAEALRQHRAYAPCGLDELFDLGTLPEGPKFDCADPRDLLGELQRMNTALMAALSEARDCADAARDFGLSNFIQDREAAHLKWDWQLRAMLKGA